MAGVNQGSNIFGPVTSTLDACLTDSSGLIYFGKCTGAPPATAHIFAHGCLLIRTDSGTNNPALYENIGSSASPSFNLVGAVSAGEITLATGSILIGAAGVGAALDVKTSGQILVGNGTTGVSVAVSGDATLASSGAITIANSAVSPAKQTTAARTRTVILPLKFPATTGSNQGPFTACTFKCSQALSIVSVNIASDIATSGSDATNNYNFLPLNITAAANLHTSATTTQGAELSITNPKAITISQNQSFAANDVFGITTNIADDGSAGPTNISAAQLYAIVEFTI